MAQSYPVERPSSQVHCVLIADDLTGACDAAAPFRRQGASAHVQLGFESRAEPQHGVLAFSTDSRDVTAIEVKHRLRKVALHVQNLRPGIIFKKIDSTLRGNPGEEISAALEAFDCEAAVVAPAFPDMGRDVREGYLHSNRDPGWQPIHVRTLLRAQGLHDCNHVTPGAIHAALARGSRFVSLDATGNQDLETIAQETLRCGRRVLWAGSAGLASALARALFPGVAKQQAAPARQSAPVLFAIGSDHAVTTAQVVELCGRYPVRHLEGDSASPESLVTALRSGRHTILTIGRNTTNLEHLATLMRGSGKLLSALLLSGGDTASLVCRAIAAQAIALEGEIVTGLPWGILEGGGFQRLPVATKSGAFGASNALIEVADFFSCQTP